MSEAYAYPCHVHAASFVSIKLLGKTNYSEWQEQMMCLVDSHDMMGFLDGTLLMESQENDDSEKKAKYRKWKRSDTLVKGWIFGSLSDDVMATVVGLNAANEVWNKLKTTYTALPKTTKFKDTTRYLPIYRTVMRGNWEEAREIIKKDEDALTVKLNREGYTALHIAVDEYENIEFFKSLLKEINPEILPTLVTNQKYNALHCAAMIGNTEAAKMLVEKNPNLLFLVDKMKWLPIRRAMANSHIKTFQYLLDACIQHIGLAQQDGYHSPFEGKTGAMLLTDVLNEGLVDVAYQLIKKYPDMARTNYGRYDIPLMSIATNEDLYYSRTRYNLYQTFIYSHVPTDINNTDLTDNIQDIENQDIGNRKDVVSADEDQRRDVDCWQLSCKARKVPHVKHLQKEKLKHNKALILLKLICEEIGKSDEEIDISRHYRKAFHSAVQNDIPEAVEVIMQSFPQAIWTTNNGYFATQIAIRDRCLKVHNVLLCHLGRNKYLLHTIGDNDDNGLVHLAGQLAPIPKLNLVSGAALQMQRELQWFKGVEDFERHQYKEVENNKGETPIMVFRKEHVELRKEGESWMKKTADSYTISAALIITIVFAAAITVPGGNGNSGKPNYATKPSFFIFIISDAISLFTSTTSLLLFLSILTARYREEDFLYRLPLRLILGLAMLFLSVTSMMVAFSATLYLTFGHGRAWIVIPVATLACLPVASFVTLQLPLLVELICSTYCHGIFYKHHYHRI